MPKISVIVPVYKVEKYLSRCVDSILNQTFDDFELILVDDGSPDKSGDICEQYAKSDNRIVVIHRENGGLSVARNSGIEWALNNSDSEWITFIDSDDWIHSNYLKILLDYAKRFNTEVSICNFLRTSGYMADDVSEEKLNVHNYSSEDFFANHNLNAVVAWGKLYKKHFFEGIRYPEGRLHEDEFTTYKILFQCKDVCFVDEHLYYYFINTQGITSGMTGGKWSPSRMDFIDAAKERLKYFEINKFNRVWEWQVNQFFGCVCSYVNFLNENKSAENQEYLKYLKKKSKFFFRDRKIKTVLKISIKDNPEIYEFLYPHLMMIYWKFKGSFNKKL